MKICHDPKKYFSENLHFIELNKCEHAGVLKNMAQLGTYPVGKVDDVEIYFMHYPSIEEAKSKWLRRCTRINYDNIIYLFTENETCTKEIIREFCNLPVKNKICLTYHKYDIPGTIYSEEVHNLEEHPWRPEIVQSIIDWKKYLNGIIQT